MFPKTSPVFLPPLILHRVSPRKSRRKYFIAMAAQFTCKQFLRYKPRAFCIRGGCFSGDLKFCSLLKDLMVIKVLKR